jgi:hypothetical protein
VSKREEKERKKREKRHEMGRGRYFGLVGFQLVLTFHWGPPHELYKSIKAFTAGNLNVILLQGYSFRIIR